jgi:hypothetical protein
MREHRLRVGFRAEIELDSDPDSGNGSLRARDHGPDWQLCGGFESRRCHGVLMPGQSDSESRSELGFALVIATKPCSGLSHKKVVLVGLSVTPGLSNHRRPRTVTHTRRRRRSGFTVLRAS